MKFILSFHYMMRLLVSMIFYGYGEYLSKKFALKPDPGIVTMLLISYSLGILAWLCALIQKNQLAIVGTLWATLSILTTICIGLFIFNEKINTIGVAGIVTGGVAIVLLSMA
jgi:multidrug transporter EmrE-like cation transporter